MWGTRLSNQWLWNRYGCIINAFALRYKGIAQSALADTNINYINFAKLPHSVSWSSEGYGSYFFGLTFIYELIAYTEKYKKYTNFGVIIDILFVPFTFVWQWRNQIILFLAECLALFVSRCTLVVFALYKCSFFRLSPSVAEFWVDWLEGALFFFVRLRLSEKS